MKKKKNRPMQAELLFEVPCELGEGPLWDSRRGRLFWVDILKKQLHSLDPVTKVYNRWSLPDRLGAVVPDTGGKLIAALQGYVCRFDPETGRSEKLLDIPEPADNRSNDAKCDPAGRLWLGTLNMQERPHAANVYCIAPGGAITLKIPGTTISNGLAWTSDRRTMYFIDSPTQRIDQYDYDDRTGDIRFVKTACHVPETLGSPDGMTIDENDLLWVAHYNGSGVYHWDPRDGKLLDKIEVPAPHVTSCTFGGDSFSKLYITTAREGLTAEEEKTFPLSGSVFVAGTNTRGSAADAFKG